jgi:hypothetical protein
VENRGVKLRAFVFALVGQLDPAKCRFGEPKAGNVYWFMPPFLVWYQSHKQTSLMGFFERKKRKSKIEKILWENEPN